MSDDTHGITWHYLVQDPQGCYLITAAGNSPLGGKLSLITLALPETPQHTQIVESIVADLRWLAEYVEAATTREEAG